MIPDIAPGHWDTPEGRELAERALTETRSQLTKGQLSDFALANAVFMANRYGLDLIVYQTAAKERIRWLSAMLAAVTADLELTSEALRAIEDGEGDAQTIARQTMEQAGIRTKESDRTK